MTTILFHYLYRDEGNWKDYLKVALDNPNNTPVEDIERQIRACLIDGQYFYHTDVGLLHSEEAESSDWHEFDCVEETESPFVPAPIMTVQTLIERFMVQAERQKQVCLRKPVVHKVAAIIPVRLAVSWLEFLRETRQSIEIIVNACKGKKTVMVFNDDDWELFSETLELDARSGNFDKDLRKNILRALDRTVTIEIDSLKPLRRKFSSLEARMKKIVERAEA